MSSPSMVGSQDLVRLVIQFLRENNLHCTLHALENESNVTFNAVEDKEALYRDMTQGRWDAVLRQITTMKIPNEKLIDLYEQITAELAEQGEVGAARMLLCKSEPMLEMMQTDPDRYIKLEKLLSKDIFDATAFYEAGSSQEKRRQAIADNLAADIVQVPPSRLLALLGQSVKWLQQKGTVEPDTTFDLFRGTMQRHSTDYDLSALVPYLNIKFPGKKTHAECAVFAPNGRYIATGTTDGFIELWNYSTGKLRTDFKYQADDNLMVMDKAVLCLGFSHDSELLASGSMDGKIAVWKIQSGNCQNRFPAAHSQGVTSVCFNKHGTQILSGSHDHSVRIHGLKSGKMLKEFRGHMSFVNGVLYSADNKTVISASSDGTVKIWDTKSTTCRFSIVPRTSMGGPKGTFTAVGSIANQTVQSVVAIPDQPDQFLVCCRSTTLYVISVRGEVVATYSHNQKTDADFVAAALSPRGDYIYALSEDSTLYAFARRTRKLAGEMKISEAESMGITSHPFANIVATYDDRGYVYFFKP